MHAVGLQVVRYLTGADVTVIRWVEGVVVVAVNKKQLSERCRGGTSKFTLTPFDRLFDELNSLDHILLLAPNNHCVGIAVVKVDIEIVTTKLHSALQVVHLKLCLLGEKWRQ